MAGYSGTPLQKKLGIKSGYTILLVNEPDNYFDLIGDLPEESQLVRADHPDPIDFIHVFCEDEQSLLNCFPPLKDKLTKNGILWVSWIKKSSKLGTDISGNEVRSLGLHIGLVDVKVCAVDEDWSGLKFMYRKEDR